MLQEVGTVGLDVRLASWFYTRNSTIEGRRVVAVDGKTMCGARTMRIRRRVFSRP